MRLELEGKKLRRRKEKKNPDVPVSKTIYAVLGFLDEYMGRAIAKDGELVEGFSVSFTEQSDIFEQYLVRLINEYNLSTSLRREISEGHTYFFSLELTQLINSFYLKHYLTGMDADGNPAYTTGLGFWKRNTGKISAKVFPCGDREAKISYLIGTHQRYGTENCFLFANAYHKAQLVYQLLKELGSPSVVFVHPDPDKIPSCFQVAFEPTAELIERLCLRTFDSNEV